MSLPPCRRSKPGQFKGSPPRGLICERCAIQQDRVVSGNGVSAKTDGRNAASQRVIRSIKRKAPFEHLCKGGKALGWQMPRRSAVGTQTNTPTLR